jgi:hypothetical protein
MFRRIKTFCNTVKAKVRAILSWFSDFGVFLKFQFRATKRILAAKFGYTYAVGLRCGVSVELGRVRLVVQTRNGSEYIMDMNPDMAERVREELKSCIDAVYVG